MAVIARQRKHGIVYRVMHRVHGVPVWETIGADKQAAHRRNAAMKREIKAGTYVARGTGASTVGTWARQWFKARTARSVDNEHGLWKNHVERRCAWFPKMRLEDVKPETMDQLVGELKLPYESPRTGKVHTLAGKSVYLVFGVVAAIFRAARRRGLMTINPCEMPRGTFIKTPRAERVPYTYWDVKKLTDPDVGPPEGVVLAMLLFYTGTRLGEACGLRWRDWDRGPEPLTSLLVDSQYCDEPLKTARTTTEKPRLVPVHVELVTVLENWWAEGFEHVYRRRPTPGDFIVPCRNFETGNHTKSSGYKLFVRLCEAAGVTPHEGAVHCTRHTFITLARRDRAPADDVEKITHNAKGKTIDGYTHDVWEPLCEAMACFMKTPPRRPPPDLRVVAASKPRDDVATSKTPVIPNAPKTRQAAPDERRDRARVHTE